MGAGFRAKLFFLDSAQIDSPNIKSVFVSPQFHGTSYSILAMSREYFTDSKLNDAVADRTRNDSEKAQIEPTAEKKGVLATYDTSGAEQKVLLKLDAVILPLTALLYVSACLETVTLIYH